MRITSAKFMSIGLGLAACATATVAFAGLVVRRQVEVVPDRSFQGSPAIARYSSDSTQEFGCYAGYNVAGSPTASCWARDSFNRYASCITSDSTLIGLASKMDPWSYANITYDFQTGSCLSITIYQESSWIP
jgi:hypothetical protein